jgi:NAD(P)-dependent dehydrogenase (short-subunit alcohol dehydrogenase family)
VTTSNLAVVTGAASGIGRATALRLARGGYEIAMMDLDAAGLTETSPPIEQADGRADAFPVNGCDPFSVGSVTRKVTVTVGPPQVLVNVAGIGLAASVLETSDEDRNRVLAGNLTGPFLIIRATLPLMLDRGSGADVSIALVAGQVGPARRAAYCASRPGSSGSPARSPWTTPARASAVWRCAPGPWRRSRSRRSSRTSLTRRPCARRWQSGRYGRMGSPDEVAAMVAFVASPDSRFVNGAALVLDGGMTAA